ncbi:MAG: hypothetical protein Q8Q92_03030, partial [bacterium]|nr:hypothetical protein [bacterium]
LVDRAVQQQFAPLEEEKQVLISNLDLILKSPAYSFAEKNRATRQKALEEDRSAKITKQKEDVTAGQAMAAAAVKNYADNQEVLFAAQQVLKLDPLSPDYLSRAFGLVGKYQRDPQAIQRAILENRKTEEEIAKLRAGEAQKTVQGGEAQKIMQGGEAQLYSGLSASTATAVRSRVSKFASEPTIQNFATIQEGRNFSQAISDTTKNPADDQALIYSLAKALDPGSVVREGEYATAQKYAQSWINAYGKGIEQALLGTGFLSQKARENIKKTIEQKYQASKRSYDSLLGQYKTGINNLTGRSDGSKFLTDYTVEKNSGEGEEMVNGIVYEKMADGLYFPKK